MPLIHQLPPNVVNKIAAGEVIERPASVVKELMENSIDAAATRVDVCIEQGGTGLIRVVDNGLGIQQDDLARAVASHATSKIRSDEDLFRVQTLGFRGEALASIASVSRFKIRSRASDAETGAQLENPASEDESIIPCGCPRGTTVDIRDLFYNTPVRRKFLRTTQTEVGHITESFTRLAIAYPHVSFALSHNGRSIHELPPADTWRTRIATFFGDDLAENLINVTGEDADLQLSGYAANPSHSRGNNRMQYLFLNGRFIRDRSLQHALNESYRGLLMTGRFPICFLRLSMPAEAVDVNVHPTKLEVRFQDSGRIYSHLLGTLRTRFLNTDLTARIHVSEPSTVEAADDINQHEQRSQGELPMRPAAENYTERFGEPGTAARDSAVNRLLRNAEHITARSAPQASASNWQESDSRPHSYSAISPSAADGLQPQQTDNSPHDSDVPRPTSASAMQVLNRYLISESPDGVLVIDQHALHERILYEEIRTKVLAEVVETQALLVPEPIDLSPAEAAAVLGQSQLLEQLGIKVEAFGGDTVLISSYPAMLANWSPVELLRTVAEQLTSSGKAPDRRDLLDSLLHMISCKAAIKAGDRLSAAEVEALLQQRELAQDAHHCPHGRPTALVFTREELDKQFKRT
jgi:DNA mismatch repair protein MutL